MNYYDYIECAVGLNKSWNKDIQPLLISPEHFKTFTDLHNHGLKITQLELVPVKHDDMYIKYKSADKNALIKEISDRLKEEKIFLEDNRFEYWLPTDVRQMIVWISDDLTDSEVVSFIKEKITDMKVDEFILFERPNNTDVKLIRGTVPEIRHVHFWIRK